MLTCFKVVYLCFRTIEVSLNMSIKRFNGRYEPANPKKNGGIILLIKDVGPKQRCEMLLKRSPKRGGHYHTVIHHIQADIDGQPNGQFSGEILQKLGEEDQTEMRLKTVEIANVGSVPDLQINIKEYRYENHKSCKMI